MANFRFRDNGKVQITITYGKKLNGKPKQYYRDVNYKSDKQLKIDAALFLAEIVNGTARLSESSTVETLFKHFINDYCPNELLSEATVSRYKTLYENQVATYFGNRQLNKITKADIRNWVRYLLANGRKDGGQLSRKTVKNALSMMSSMYKFAISELDLTTSNPCDLVKVPKTIEISGKKIKAKDSKQKEFYSEKEIIKLLEILQDELKNPDDITNATIIFLILFTGMRTGEVMGLKWDDVDFENKAIKIERERIYTSSGVIEKEPKTEMSERAISVPDFIIELLISLKSFQTKNKEILGDDYLDTDYVAVTLNGSPQHPRNTYKYFRRLQEKHNLKSATVHDLRHTHAAMLSRLGVQIIDISKRLGHSNTRITQEVYEYLFKDIDSTVSNELENYYKSIKS